MKLKITLTAMVAIALYFALFGGEYSLFEVRRLERQRQAEAAQLEELRGEVDRLRARADSLETHPASLERVARERYGMIKKGERLYRFVDCSDTGGADSAGAAVPDSLRCRP